MSEEKRDLKKMQTSLGGVVIPPSQIMPEDSAVETENSLMCERDQRDLLQEGVVLPANAVEPPAPAPAAPPEAAQPAPAPPPAPPAPPQDH
jgi:hypothetical protein